MREHRLYQVDFLMRRYGFEYGEIPLGSNGNLQLDKDPKEMWAERHPEFFPVRINTAEREALLRVPGIGPDTASVILKERAGHKISRLEHLGIKGKRLEKIKNHVIMD